MCTGTLGAARAVRLFCCLLVSVGGRPDTVVVQDMITVADALVAAVQMASHAVDETKPHRAEKATFPSPGWLTGAWKDACDCIRKDYLCVGGLSRCSLRARLMLALIPRAYDRPRHRFMNATCTDARKADMWDPCAVQPPQQTNDFYK